MTASMSLGPCIGDLRPGRPVLAHGLREHGEDALLKPVAWLDGESSGRLDEGVDVRAAH